MGYRDDVDALFHRARSLQAEVDRLQAELAARDAPPPPPGVAPLPPSAPRAPERTHLDDGQVLGERIVESFIRDRVAWLPPDQAAPRPPVARPAPETAGVGLLVARLSEVEHALVMRLLELLTEDEYAPVAVARNQAAFDQLVAELRARLAGPR